MYKPPTSASVGNLLAPPPPNSDQLSTAARDLLQQLSTNTVLVQLLESAGLTQTLLDKAGSITVLAPTNMAFNQLPPGLATTLLKPENADLLTAVLLYHVIANTSNLTSETSPPVIPISSILVPPNLSDNLTSLTNLTSSSVPLMSNMSPPKWLVKPKAANNLL